MLGSVLLGHSVSYDSVESEVLAFGLNPGSQKKTGGSLVSGGLIFSQSPGCWTGLWGRLASELRRKK